jgi:hypothetical protein
LPVTIGPQPIAKIWDPKAGWLIWSRVHGSVQTLADRPPQTNKQTTLLLTYVRKPCVKPHQLSDQDSGTLLWECEWHRMGSMLLLGN